MDETIFSDFIQSQTANNVSKGIQSGYQKPDDQSQYQQQAATAVVGYT